MSSLLSELKRRNVFRVAVAYLVTAWLILQIADVVLGNLTAPDWVFPVMMLVLALGFPPVLFFSWAFELTPEGLKREKDVDREQSITGDTGRRLNQVTIAMLVAVVLFVIAERTVLDRPAATDDEVTTTALVDDKSIAVLAFEDLSPEGDQAYFAEGLSEELLNVLAQVPDLKVAGRTSSFAFKGQNRDLREIGEILNVAHILEGSVRKASNRVRVTAQLIQASDGFHLFSETYDRDLDDIFAVQDELASLIGSTLQSQIMGTTSMPASTPTDIAAYDIYLLARQRIRSRDPAQMAEAADWLDQALAIDPDYAPALAQKALVTFLLSDVPGAYGDVPEAVAVPRALADVERALAIDPGLAEAHAIYGLIQSSDIDGQEAAVASLRHALELNPGLDDARNWLSAELDDVDEAIRLLEITVERDPAYGPAFNNLIQYYLGSASYDKAEALVGRVERIQGTNENVRQALGTIAYLRGELANAFRDLEVTFESNPNATVTRQWFGYVLLFLGDLERAARDGTEVQALLALDRLGEREKAEDILERIDFEVGDRQRKIRHVGNYLNANGRYGELIEIVEAHYGDVMTLIENLPMENGWGTEYLGPTAYAYLQDGREPEFRLLLEEMRRVLQVQQGMGVNNWYHWYCQSQYFLLAGDEVQAMDMLQRALDSGFVATFLFDTMFGDVEGNDRYRSITAEMKALADRERAKLGLEPYRPMAPSD